MFGNALTDWTWLKKGLIQISFLVNFRVTLSFHEYIINIFFKIMLGGREIEDYI
jgi:hypothetical protein